MDCFVFGLNLVIQALKWSERALKFEEHCLKIQESFNRICACPNRALLYDIYPYISDMKGVITMLRSYIKWLGKPNSHYILHMLCFRNYFKPTRLKFVQNRPVSRVYLLHTHTPGSNTNFGSKWTSLIAKHCLKCRNLTAKIA